MEQHFPSFRIFLQCHCPLVHQHMWRTEFTITIHHSLVTYFWQVLGGCASTKSKSPPYCPRQKHQANIIKHLCSCKFGNLRVQPPVRYPRLFFWYRHEFSGAEESRLDEENVPLNKTILTIQALQILVVSYRSKSNRSLVRCGKTQRIPIQIYLYVDHRSRSRAGLFNVCFRLPHRCSFQQKRPWVTLLQ